MKISKFRFLLITLIAFFVGSVNSAELEEIVVTATKRASTVQEVGMSLTALTSQDLEDGGVEELLDFAV